MRADAAGQSPRYQPSPTSILGLPIGSAGHFRRVVRHAMGPSSEKCGGVRYPIPRFQKAAKARPLLFDFAASSGASQCAHKCCRRPMGAMHSTSLFQSLHGCAGMVPRAFLCLGEANATTRFHERHRRLCNLGVGRTRATAVYARCWVRQWPIAGSVCLPRSGIPRRSKPERLCGRPKCRHRVSLGRGTRKQDARADRRIGAQASGRHGDWR